MTHGVVVAVACVATMLGAAPQLASEVAVDGLFDEWRDDEPMWTDQSDESRSSNTIDLQALWVRSDEERITLCFEVAGELSLQGGNLLKLVLDGDADASTGRPVQGLGAELEWSFGQRKGIISVNGSETIVEHAAIGLRQAPTVTSNRFEVSFLRKGLDGTEIAPGPTARLVLLDAAGTDGDGLPDDDGSVLLTLSDDPPASAGAVVLERGSPDDIRILTWNVLFDGLFKRPAPFIRVLRALDPDIICFQEVWAHTSQEAADQVSLALPDARWFAAASGEGHVVSRYPIRSERAIDESGNYWALIDLPDDRYDVDLSVISAHPPCCEQEAERQWELDGIAAWMRELVVPGDPSVGRPVMAAEALRPGEQPAPDFDLPWGTPIVIAGDMNLVGSASQLRTLTDGTIVNEGEFGRSYAVDWDGTPLADAWPRLAGGRDVFTWRDSRSSFAPGKLDYIVYSDSVLRRGNAFVLATEALPGEVLARYGLRREDTLEASDHLPVVADFTPVAAPARTEAVE